MGCASLGLRLMMRRHVQETDAAKLWRTTRCLRAIQPNLDGALQAIRSAASRLEPQSVSDAARHRTGAWAPYCNEMKSGADCDDALDLGGERYEDCSVARTNLVWGREMKLRTGQQLRKLSSEDNMDKPASCQQSENRIELVPQATSLHTLLEVPRLSECHVPSLCSVAWCMFA
jgi:hypothetical protein